MSIKKVVVIGGGVLGSQIAYQSAYCGFDVVTWVRSEGSIGRAKPKAERLHDIYVGELKAAKAGAPGPVSRGLVGNNADLSKIDFDKLINKKTLIKYILISVFYLFYYFIKYSIC